MIDCAGDRVEGDSGNSIGSGDSGDSGDHDDKLWPGDTPWRHTVVTVLTVVGRQWCSGDSGPP
jgi:hypothetical protein